MNKFPNIGDTVRYRKYDSKGFYYGTGTGYVTYVSSQDMLTFRYEPEELKFIPYVSIALARGSKESGVNIPAIGFPSARLVLTEKHLANLFYEIQHT